MNEQRAKSFLSCLGNGAGSEQRAYELDTDEELENSPVKFEILIQKSDLDLILFLKEQLNVSETELRSVGFIVLSSLRSFC